MYAGAHNLHSAHSLKSSVAGRELGIVPTEIELQMMIEEIDVDNSGDIDMHEFVSAISVALLSHSGDKKFFVMRSNPSGCTR